MILNASKYRSYFGGLWTDMANAHEEVEAKLAAGIITAQERQLLDHWVEKGYVIIPNAVPHDVIDQINIDIELAWKSLDNRVKVAAGSYGTSSLHTSKRDEPGCRILDFYALYPSCLEAMFADKILRFLEIIFDQNILAFQSLSFEIGTEQGMHQDTAYVVLSSPMKLAASWIALEDIEYGSGELIYYEGSHKIEEFLFEGIYKHWDGQSLEVHHEYLDALHSKSQKLNLPLKKFQAKKGDVLIWSADLVHGGSKINHANPNQTRRSLVTHYCPYNVNPNYFRIAPHNRTKLNFKEGCYYSSYHHNISEREHKLDEGTFKTIQLQEEIETLKKNINAMENSKFWKLRSVWLNLKKAIKLDDK
ncbi:phytanoyl-CoA dioxygenase family protein [Calothrix sp. CCY 0018]|uniref:phytanoyl-CoA dioxygenase family protein n=1 Tax=Calothrix sp. CCY 0018 TaxID=3103864 RepID=UPI0039C7231D